jgi:hypothetical protein
MKWLVQFFHLIGFEFSGRFFSTSFQEKVQKIIFFLHLLYIFINLKFQYEFHSQLFIHPDFFGNVTNLIEMLAPVLCHFTIIFTSFVNKSKGCQIAEIQIELCRKLQVKYCFKFGKFLWLFGINTLLFVIIFAILNDIKGKNIIQINHRKS